ncbi:MAG TPA: hypothetical protein VIC62_04730 [Nakamurella sp.]|jgi:hypothetical protein
MRTTVTLDPDVAELLRRLMTERGLTFKDAVNSAIRSALTPGGDPSRDVPLPAFDMGEPRVPLEHALRLAADLADEEIARKLAGGK